MKRKDLSHRNNLHNPSGQPQAVMMKHVRSAVRASQRVISTSFNPAITSSARVASVKTLKI